MQKNELKLDIIGPTTLTQAAKILIQNHKFGGLVKTQDNLPKIIITEARRRPAQ